MYRRHFPRHRPPWWPENEAWPPAHYPRLRRPFFWRLGCFFFLFMLFSVAGALTIVSLVLRLLGVSAMPAPDFGLAFFVLVVFGLVLVARGLRRLALPLGEVMDAAGRVSEGDYTVRVAMRGPRDVRALARSFNTMAERLQQNDAQRRNLMAEVAHELRTPLAVIQGRLEGLLDGVYPRDDPHLAPILDETRVLARLVEDLRTLALSESGALALQKEPVDIAVLVNEAAALFRPQADAAGVTLLVDVAGEIPILEIDPTRIREVLANLLANALRYTAGGGTVRVLASLDQDRRHVRVAVSDTGTGIAPEDLPHVFDRFYRTRDSHGSGLGLAIARNLVAAHGGEISAQSEPGRGTTITFTLPVGR